jgi:hypothetical protein
MVAITMGELSPIMTGLVFAQLGAAPDLAWLDALRQRTPSGASQGLRRRELQVLRLVGSVRKISRN